MNADTINAIIGIGCTVAIFGVTGGGFWWMQGQSERRRKRALRNPPPLPLHRGDPLLGRLVDACGRQDLQTLQRELGAMRGDWQRRSYYLDAILLDLPRARVALDRWVADAPQDPLARLLQGICLIAWAWEARGTGLSSSVTEDGRRLFSERLQLARQALREAAALAPDDPHPWGELVLVGQASGEPDAVLEEAYQEALRRDPSSFHAHWRRVNSLLEKWSGQEHAARERAREVARAAAPGSDLPMLLAFALAEERSARLRRSGHAAADAFARAPAFRQELEWAMRRSILHPAHVDGHGWALLAVNWGAFLSRLVRDDATLRGLLERLGDKAGVCGWNIAEAKRPGYVAEARVSVGLL